MLGAEDIRIKRDETEMTVPRCNESLGTLPGHISDLTLIQQG
jgi:hypothetical protein